MKLLNPLVVLDLETTGTWVDRDKIIEIAMIKCQLDGTEETYDKRVNPGMLIPESVTALTGITNESVKNAPAFKDIAREVVAFLEGCDLAGFNVARFDLPLLQREIDEAGLKFDPVGVRVYDAQKVFHLNEKRDLTAAYQYYCRKDLNDAHSALADSRATLEILAAQVAKYGQGDPSLKALDKFDYQQTAEFLDDERKFRWWNGKAYMMFGKYAKRYSLQEIAKMDPAYLQWILSAKFSEDVKTLVSNALQGRFPVFELKDKNGSSEEQG